MVWLPRFDFELYRSEMLDATSMAMLLFVYTAAARRHFPVIAVTDGGGAHAAYLNEGVACVACICVNLRMTPFPRKRVAMEYLNRAVLDAVAEDAFRNRAAVSLDELGKTRLTP